MAHLIYGLFDPREPEVVKYVGYTGYNAEYRLQQHVAEAKQNKQNYRCNWIRSLLNVGIRPEVKVLEIVSESTWQEREKHWIDIFADSVTNGTAGGEGLVNPSQEVRDKISKTLKESGVSLGNQHRKGIAHTPESKKAISEGMKNSERMKAYNLSRKGVDPHAGLTPEQLKERNDKIRQKKLGVKRAPFSDEARQRMSEAHIGIKLPSASAKKQGSRFINDGKIVKQLKANEPLPDGWVYGMKLKTGE